MLHKQEKFCAAGFSLFTLDLSPIFPQGNPKSLIHNLKKIEGKQVLRAINGNGNKGKFFLNCCNNQISPMWDQ